MSQKAVQNSNNNGGAQAATHVVSVIVNNQPDYNEILLKSDFHDGKSSGCNQAAIQDGGSCAPFRPLVRPMPIETVSPDPDDIMSTLPLDDSMSISMGSGQEWITTSVDGLGKIFGVANRSKAFTDSDNVNDHVHDEVNPASQINNINDSRHLPCRLSVSSKLNLKTDVLDAVGDRPTSATPRKISKVNKPNANITFTPNSNNFRPLMATSLLASDRSTEKSKAEQVCISNFHKEDDNIDIMDQLVTDESDAVIKAKKDPKTTCTIRSRSVLGRLSSKEQNVLGVTVRSTNSDTNTMQYAVTSESSAGSLFVLPDHAKGKDIHLQSFGESTIQLLDLPANISSSVAEGFTFTLEESHIISGNSKMNVVGKDDVQNLYRGKRTIKQENKEPGVGELSLQERACLEEIERGSQLTDEEKELIAERQREIQAINDFSSLIEQGKTPATMSMMSDEITDDCHTHILKSQPEDPAAVTDTANQLRSSDNNTNISLSTPGPGDTLLVQLTDTGDVISCESSDAVNSAEALHLAAGDSDVQYVSTESGVHQVIQIASKKSGSTHVLPDTAQLVALPNGSLLLLSSQSAAGETLLEGESIVSTAITKDPGKRSTAKHTVTKEMNANDEVDTKVFICSFDECGQRFSKPSRLKIHEMTHRGERPYRCSESECGWAFTTAYKLKRHEECHQKKKDFVCSFPGCDRQFTTIYNLKSHLRLHQRPHTVACTFPGCPDKFATRKQLDLHLKTHDNAQKTYKCPHEGCEKMFFSPYCMGSHVRVHQRQREFICDFEGCGKVFDKQCRLNQHTRCHSGERPYICPIEGCNWSFTSSSKLRRHLHTHTGERQWICPIGDCGKRFLRSEHLKGHIITHTGEKPFLCSFEGCGMRFSARSSLYVHAKKHKEPARGVIYFCPLEGCNSRYKSKSQLRTHIEKHYKKQLPKTGCTANADSDVIPMEETVESLASAEEKDETAIAPLFLLDESTAKIITAGSDSLAAVSQGTSTTVTVNMVDTVGAGGEGSRAMPYAVLPVNLDLSQAVQSQMPAGLVLTTSDSSDIQTDVPVTESEVASTSLLDKGGTGSARTDWKSNQLLSSRAKRRRLHQKENPQLSWELATMPQIQGETNEWSQVSSTDANLTTSDSESATFSLSDVMTSQAITFRDPETGAIYVQTQLLQDDPPTLEGYGDEDGCVAMDTSLEAELSSILHDDTQGTEAADDNPTIDFASTTINLQDLA